MNRCPSCRNLVPAGWIACRRCGAALNVGRPVAANGGSALPRRSALPGATSTATLARPAAAPPPPLPPLPSAAPPNGSARPVAPMRDTILPGDNVDTLVSAKARTRPRTKRRTGVVVACLALGAVAVIACAVVGVVHRRDTTSADPRLQAETILRQAAAAAAPTYAQHSSFATITPSLLTPLSGHTVVSANTTTRAGKSH